MKDMYSITPPEGRHGLSVWRLNRVLAMIQSKIQQMNEEGRRFPIVWSSHHMYSTSQLAKVLALKRGIDPELAGITGALHDIFTLLTGSSTDHALRAEKHIREIISDYNENWKENLPEITKEELELIVKSILGHSDKLTVSESPMAELIKDADTFDAYLQGMTADADTGRLDRLKSILHELGIDNQILIK